MKIHNMLGTFAGEVARAIRNFKYDVTGTGVYIPSAKVSVGGVFRHAHAPAGGEFGPWAVDPNRVVSQGLNHILNTALGGASQVTAYSLAPFSGNVTPAANWTGANFTANSTEFTAYTAATRLPWTTTASTAQSLGNTAGIADSTMTLNGTGPHNVYGVGLLQASAKSATTGVLVAATRFATPRTNMAPGDRLAIEYIIAAVDEADV